MLFILSVSSSIPLISIGKFLHLVKLPFIFLQLLWLLTTSYDIGFLSAFIAHIALYGQEEKESLYPPCPRNTIIERVAFTAWTVPQRCNVTRILFCFVILHSCLTIYFYPEARRSYCMATASSKTSPNRPNVSIAVSIALSLSISLPGRAFSAAVNDPHIWPDSAP